MYFFRIKIRKLEKQNELFNHFIALIFPALTIVCLSFVACKNPYLAVGILTFGISIRF
jgi:hypothetical protein